MFNLRSKGFSFSTTILHRGMKVRMTKSYSKAIVVLITVGVIVATIMIMAGCSSVLLSFTQQQSASAALSTPSSFPKLSNPMGPFGNLNASMNNNSNNKTNVFNIPPTTNIPNQNQLFNSPSNNNPFPNLPPPLSSPSSISITGENKNAYTISSGFTKVVNFLTIYTIVGGLDSIKSSSDLIVSTITNDFDSSANIGYVTRGPGSAQQTSKSTLPNPFVDKSIINETISTAIQNAISSSSLSFGGYAQIQCAFGMNLANYKCMSGVPFATNK
jgi:hypothetical protein